MPTPTFREMWDSITGGIAVLKQIDGTDEPDPCGECRAHPELVDADGCNACERPAGALRDAALQMGIPGAELYPPAGGMEVTD
jgi:hypothetical protein